MGLLNRSHKSIDELEADLEASMLESKIAGNESDIAERRALIKELEKRHGPGWRQLLGAKSHLNLADLRGFLSSAKGGMRQNASEWTLRPSAFRNPIAMSDSKQQEVEENGEGTKQGIRIP